MPHDWLTLIDTRAALKEQFPTLRDVKRERPGSPTDNAMRAFYAADNQRSVQAEQNARWHAAIAKNNRARQDRERRAANAAYRARQQQKDTNR